MLSCEGLLSMKDNELKQHIESTLENARALVQGDYVQGDGSHFQVTVICNTFEGLSRVKRQQMVYASLNELITSGRIHAVNLKTYTEQEWERQ